MLSQLLRRLLLGQVLVGALLGWVITRQTGASSWLAAVTALGMPLLTLLLVIMTSAIRSRVPGAGTLWWRSMFAEFVASSRVFLLRQPWAQAPPVVRLASALPFRIPVVLVHGYLCNHRVWDVMSQHLNGAGHAVLALDLEPLFTSIDRYAPLIEQAVLTLCQRTGAQKVALIGHSMGGLAIRAWMRSHGSSRVARVITLGTPHIGTRIDLRPSTDNGRQMLFRSAWLQELAASENDSARGLLRIALTPQDSIVYPQLEQTLEGVPVTVFDGLGHLELCLHPGVIAWVLQQLLDSVPAGIKNAEPPR